MSTQENVQIAKDSFAAVGRDDKQGSGRMRSGCSLLSDWSRSSPRKAADGWKQSAPSLR